MKKMAKSAVAAVLGYQVRRLHKKNDFKIVAVAGSIGKTSTKLAIAKTLQAGLRVRFEDGNYNDLVSVPLVFFDERLPSLFNPLAWLGVFWRNQRKLGRAYPYDVVVVELGSDGPGQIRQFKNYIKAEIGVVTAITPEHMQFFKDLDAVAAEELAITRFSALTLINKDLCDKKYLKDLPDILTYGVDKPADYSYESPGGEALVKAGNETVIKIKKPSLNRTGIYSQLAAAVTAVKLGIEPAQAQKALADIQPAPGRMQLLAGIKDSTIIDDSYNSSPDAVRLALQSLYDMKAPQKIAVLGNMNELGGYSKDAHRAAGELCDPKQLSLVVTIGSDANQYLAAAAEAKGCRVERFDSPYQAGEYLKPLVKESAAILVKGSQNGVFAEETIKNLLADPADADKLVRQDPRWLKIKRKSFLK